MALHLRRRFFVPAIILLAILTGLVTSCHPTYSKRIRNIHAADTTQNAALAADYPLPEYFEGIQHILLRHSQPTTKVLIPDGEHQQGIFSHGKIDLVLEEIDGEPGYYHGHPPGTNPDSTVSLIIYGIPNKELDKLVEGNTYTVHWIETVVNTQPFDDDLYRQFLTYRIEGK